MIDHAGDAGPDRFAQSATWLSSGRVDAEFGRYRCDRARRRDLSKTFGFKPAKKSRVEIPGGEWS
jgi:hypothetical protein